MSAPLFIGLLLFASTTVADAYFLGRLGTQALTGFGFGLPLWILIQSLIVGFVSGPTAVVSRTLGAEGERRALAHLKDGALSATVLGVVLGVLLYLGRNWLLQTDRRRVIANTALQDWRSARVLSPAAPSW